MARYKGKREAPRQELFARGHAHEREGREGLLVEEEIFQEETVFDTEVVTDDAMDDVFVRTKEPFFRTRTGRVLTVVGIIALVLIALVVAVVLIWKSNVKPPELPNVADDPTHNDVGNQNNVIGNLGNNSQNTVPDEPVDEPPTDDELYPDDGYAGEVPAVSGSRKEVVYTFLLV